MAFPNNQIDPSASNQTGRTLGTQAVLLIAADSGALSNTGPTAAQIAAAVPVFSNSDPSALAGLVAGAIVPGTGSAAGEIWFANDAGTPVKLIKNGALVGTVIVDAIDLGDNDPIRLGDGDDDTIVHTGTLTSWTHTTGSLVFDNQDVNDPIILRVGADSSATTIDLRNNSDVSLFSMIPSGAAAGDWKGLDNADLVVGTGNDFRVNHNGTLTTITSATGNLLIDNTAATGSTLLDMGADTSATSVAIRNNGGTTRFSVDGAGTITIPDGSTLFTAGAGTGTGDLVQVYGPDITHGWARYVYQADVTPAAVETALFTVPAMSRLIVAQANVQSALTGGGTTVTFGIGITGDVDAYGTASNSGVQADLLTQNAKINAMAGIAANAGASLGVFSAATVALKLIAAATGGASAGDTALTVGTVRIRIVYETLLPLANA